MCVSVCSSVAKYTIIYCKQAAGHRIAKFWIYTCWQDMFIDQFSSKSSTSLIFIFKVEIRIKNIGKFICDYLSNGDLIRFNSFLYCRCCLLSSPMSLAVCILCINVCCRVAKILKQITYMESSISSRMAQDSVFYFLYSTFIFKVKVFAFSSFANIS